ncbi:DUF4097 family beta strand repeat protein [Microtetraspora sp. AC03309]|uniref:DUF4097 family beta strand repeat-containing protein n=1 Tax=Microtetraspora sp. AC03309 TaxID=2779376 RepID=UPI001E626B43|nr:DUF4097 family beta strand repeat-containing protein [Microtetraspora sp. AC03309]MCC5581669.1 DUF4097 family beta strand repeat protein [Microtetraspora sp. AC03309]
MRKQLRFLGAVVTAGICVSTLGACDLRAKSTLQDDAVVSEKITSVRLESDSGGVTLRGAKNAGEVSVRRLMEYIGDPREGTTYRVENGVLILGGCGRHCSVNYTVDLPAGLPVSGETSSGAVALTDVGEVDVTTTSGAIELDGVTGAVVARTSNGRITGRGLNGERVQARTSNGAIDLTLATPQDVRAETSNGGITLTVPAGRYKVSARTQNGGKDIGVSDDPAGEHQLDLSTSNGAITVKPA